jgi:transcriptional regulator with XRE-family HTH domain
MVVMSDTAPRSHRVPGGVDGARIKRLRIEAGLTGAMLGESAGISKQFVCDIERRRRSCSPPVLRRLAAALGTTSTNLMRSPESKRVDK